MLIMHHMSEIKVQHPENKNGSVVSVREGCSLNTNNSLQQGLDSQDVKLQILNQSETWLDGHNSKLLGLVIKSSIFFRKSPSVEYIDTQR